MSLAQLRKAAAAYRASYARAERDRQQRNRLLRSELREGRSPGEVSEAAGLSSGRISQIAGNGKREA